VKPAAMWILNLEESANVTEYLIIVWGDGRVEFEESPALDELLRPQDRHPIDGRALFFHEYMVDFRDLTDVLCDHTRQIKLPRSLLRQILRAARRGFYRDNARLPEDDAWRGPVDPLAKTIDGRLEALFWLEIVPYLIIRPTQRLDASTVQVRRPPRNAELNFPSRVDSPTRF